MKPATYLPLLCGLFASGAANSATFSLTIEDLQMKHASRIARLDALAKIAGLDQSVGKMIPEPAAARRLSAVALQFDTLWALVCGALVMFMQAGFAFLESGSVRKINAGTVLLKNVMDVCIGTVMWYICGYAFAYGEPAGDASTFIGLSGFAGSSFGTEAADGSYTGTTHFYAWFFQWAFCATSATIVSGGVAERIRFPAYIIYSIVMTALIYPVIVHWTWASSGWLYSNGYGDFAGSGIVHLTGGIGALVGAIMLGPRTGRWEAPDDFAPQDVSLIVLGTLILWFGWYGFNCGSTLTFNSKSDSYIASVVAMNTTLSASVGGLTALTLHGVVKKSFDICGMCNGILAGLVAVCAGVNVYRSGLAVVVGMLGAAAYFATSMLMKKLKVDDPLDAFAVHGAAGITGLILKPLLDLNGVSSSGLGWNAIGVVMIIIWSGGISLLVFGCLRLAKKLRVDEMEEMEGGDVKLAHSPPKEHLEI